MRRSSTDETPYRRSPSLDSKPGSPPPNPFRRYSSSYGSPFSFGLHAAPGPQTTKGRYTSPKGNKYVVFYLDLSFILLLELQRCRLARACLGTVKGLMVLFNLLFWLGGCGLLGVGIWLAVTQGSFATLSSSVPSLSAANLLIATGTIVMVVGGLGCVGAFRENKVLLLSFFILLLLIFLLEALSIILFFAYKDEIDRYAQADLKRGLQFFGTEGNIGLTNAWSIVQTDFRCCGVSNHTDWFSVYNDTRVPDSCCLEYSENCGLERPDTWWTAPCYKQVKSWMQHNLLSLWVSALCTGVTQPMHADAVTHLIYTSILGLAFAMTMLCQVAKCDTFYT